MPIRPENRERYPADWPAISRRIREQAGQKCEQCGAPNGAIVARVAGSGVWADTDPLIEHGGHEPQAGDPSLTWENAADQLNAWRDERGRPVHWLDRPSGRVRLVRVVLTVAHLNHTPEDCRDHNLAALCQRCHNAYDAKTRASGVRARRAATPLPLFAVGEAFG